MIRKNSVCKEIIKMREDVMEMDEGVLADYVIGSGLYAGKKAKKAFLRTINSIEKYESEYIKGLAEFTLLPIAIVMISGNWVLWRVGKLTMWVSISLIQRFIEFLTGTLPGDRRRSEYERLLREYEKKTGEKKNGGKAVKKTVFKKA